MQLKGAVYPLRGSLSPKIGFTFFYFYVGIVLLAKVTQSVDSGRVREDSRYFKHRLNNKLFIIWKQMN